MPPVGRPARRSSLRPANSCARSMPGRRWGISVEMQEREPDAGLRQGNIHDYVLGAPPAPW